MNGSAASLQLGCVVRSAAEAEHASELPLDYLELKGDMLWLDPLHLAAHVARLRRLGLPIRALTSPLPRKLECRVVGADADLPHALDVFRRMCANAGELGTEIVVLGSGQARSVPAGFPGDEALRQFECFVVAAAATCEEYRMTLAIEPLNSTETNLLNSCAETRAVIDRLSATGVRMVVDCYHILSEGLSLTSEIGAARGVIGHAHTSGRPRHCRNLDLDVQTAFIANVREAGYAGTLSLECDFEDFSRDAGPAVDALRSLTR